MTLWVWRNEVHDANGRTIAKFSSCSAAMRAQARLNGHTGYPVGPEDKPTDLETEKRLRELLDLRRRPAGMTPQMMPTAPPRPGFYSRTDMP